MRYEYSNDIDFLKEINEATHTEQYIRITVLNFKTEKELASIEGKTTGGSVSLNGTSNMRRTGSCSLVVDPNGVFINNEQEYRQYYNITEVENLISLNKKIRIETGFKNNSLSFKYDNHKIIWFPLGTFVIKNASISSNNSGINISLTLNDKCALLNGDMGGTIPAATIFSESELYNSTGTKREVKKILIKDIIKELVVEFGGEKPENVIITDIPDTIVKVVKWSGKSTLYLIEGENTRFTLEKPTEVNGITIKDFSYGMDIGYMNEPFVYPGTLECNAGESVATMLDKIKNVLGNFEWFYDIDGRFIFQKIRNYLNNSLSSGYDYKNINEEDYFLFTNNSKSIYTFDRRNKNLITSFSNNPQYSNVKNDFVIWGITKTATGADKPIRYHVAFATKPNIGNRYFCLVGPDYKGQQQAIILKDGVNAMVKTSRSIMINKDFYYIDRDTLNVYHWSNEENSFLQLIDYKLCYIETNDWRTELYLQGLSKDNITFARAPFFAELNAEWTKIYDIAKEKKETALLFGKEVPVYIGGFRESKEIDITNYEYWLEFLDGGSDPNLNISQFNIDNIGIRSKVVSENSVNCIFPIEIPNYVLIEADGDTTEDKDIAEKNRQVAIQVESDLFKNMTLGGGRNSAFDKATELLHSYSGYNESISLSVIPLFFLEPNTRISVFDEQTCIYGDYLIKSISLPLAVNGTSSISATKCIEKTI